MALQAVKVSPQDGAEVRTGTILPALLHANGAHDHLKDAAGVKELETIERTCPFSGFDHTAIEATVRAR